MRNKGRKFDKNAPKGAKPAHNGRNEKPRADRVKEPPAPKTRLARADLFGFHAVAEAWMNPKRQISALYLTETAKDGFVEYISRAQKVGLPRPAPQIVDKQALEGALPDGAVHQGLGLVCSALPEIGAADLIIKAAAKADSLIVILDQVTDPHNIGAIMRSACAFGADGMIMQRKHAPEVTGTLAKTACGAAEHMPVAYETNLSRTIEALQEGGFFVYGLDERGEIEIGQIKTGGKTAIVLGAEGPGIRHLVKEHCDALVRLPMNGPMPSINVSNAAAVALHALRAR